MNSKENAPSSSKRTNNGFAENMIPQFTNPFGMQPLHGMPWNAPPSQNMNSFFAAATQMQNNPWSQQQFLPSGMVGMPSVQRNQSQVPAYNTRGMAVPANSLYVGVTRVGCALDDENLAQALHDSTDRGQTYKQAIEGLHGINQYPAHSWKDYYLDHASRIDTLVSRLAAVPDTKTMKKPFSYPSVDAGRKVSSLSTNRRRDPGHKLQEKPYEHSKTSRSRKATARTMRPPTISAIKLPARASIPSLPLRSPSPPTIVVPTYPNSTAHVFTDADRVFFFEFIQWELNRDVTLGKFALCEMLGKKAPHHTTSSWAYFWKKYDVLADKILAAAREPGTNDDMEKSGDSMASAFSESREDNRIDGHLEWEMSSLSDPESDASDFGCLEEAPGGDERAMGQTAGDVYTMADNRVMAKYIANLEENWGALTAKERWARFCERYPQREYSSWQKHYKRNKAVISKLIRKYQKRDARPAHKPTSIKSTRGEPLPRRQSSPSLSLLPKSAEQTRVREEEKMAIEALNSMRKYGDAREPSADVMPCRSPFLT